MIKVGRPLAFFSFVAAVTLVTASCGSSSKKSATSPTSGGGGSATSSGAANNTASAPGVTKDTINIGLLTSVTGNAASTFGDTADGAKARIDAQNAKGGVYGRKIVLTVADDASSPTIDLTAAQSLVEAKSSFAVIGYSPYLFGGYRYLTAQGIPVVGSGFDGPEWHQQPNTNMFSWGAADPTKEAYTTYGEFFKKIGATNVAGVAYGNSPSSTGSIKGLKASVEAVGLKAGYINLSFPFGGVDFTATVLAMKQAGVDGATCSCVQSSNLAMFTAIKQAGLNVKGGLAFAGPDNSVFASSTDAAAAQGQYFSTAQTPYIVNTSATQTYQNNLKQYAPSFHGGFPSFGQSGGYISADLLIRGLMVAGQNPTRTSFMDNLRANVHAYDAGGLLASPVSFAAATFTSEPDTTCTYFLQVKGSGWVLPFDKICGTKIPGTAPS
jgi:branched-chain amino acid transport system substrate-binding protein